MSKKLLKKYCQSRRTQLQQELQHVTKCYEEAIAIAGGDRIALFQELRSRGWGVELIAQVEGICKQRVHQLLQNATKEAIAERLRRGESVEAIAQAEKVHRSTVLRERDKIEKS